jgi:hypothetical protein
VWFCSIAIVASSKSHSFDPQHVNMTHRVHQLSFVNPVAEGAHILAKDKEKMYRSETMNEKWHVSKAGHASIEHYVKVLHVTDVSAMGYVAEEYKYTSASGLVSENKELVPGDQPSLRCPPLPPILPALPGCAPVLLLTP